MSTTSVASPLLTVEETAQYLNRNKLWVYRKLRYQLPIHILGRRIYFSRADLNRYIASCRREPPKP